MSANQMATGDPVWKRPGHFDRFEFKNRTAAPQSLAAVHFEFKDKNDGIVCLVQLANPPVLLQPDGMWGWTPQPDQGYGDAVKFSGHVDVVGAPRIDFNFVLVDKPPYSYIWVARLGIETDPVAGLVGYGEVECMEPETVPLP